MENKLTKEYAEKLAEECCSVKSEYVRGYLKAIEETNAKELLEALIGLRKETLNLIEHCVDQRYIDWEDESIEGVTDMNTKLELAIDAINKATK